MPKNEMKRKPTAKKSFSMLDFKKKIGGEDVPNKPLKWINCSPALKEVTGLPGIPQGYVTLCRGFSNTGKSTLLSEAVVSAQKNGILPIIIDTENNLSRDRLELMGFSFDKKNPFYVIVDNEFLLEEFGKKRDSSRKEASIEDLAECVNYFLDLQENDELPYDLLFAIDSFGTINSGKSIRAHEKDTSDNNMWNAGAFESSFKSILNARIPMSRKVNKKYTNTLLAAQKVWLDSMQGAGVLKNKWGESAFFASRVLFTFGGVQTHGTKKVVATSKGKNVIFGMETKVSVTKNQVDGDLGGIAMEGKLISTPHGFITTEKVDIDKYKKENILYFRDKLGNDIDIDSIETKIVDDEETLTPLEKLNKQMESNVEFDKQK